MSKETPGTLVALLGPDLVVAVQMHWAVQLAMSRKLDLLILQRAEDGQDHVSEVALQDPPKVDPTGAIREVKRIVEEAPEIHAGPRKSAPEGDESVDEETAAHVVYVRLRQVFFTSLTSLRKAILDELDSEDAELFTVARKQIADETDADFVRERRLLLRYVPCEVVLRLGLEETKALKHILLATTPGRHGRAALRLGVDLAAASKATLTALHVNPNVGVDAERVGQRRLARFLEKSLHEEAPGLHRRVVVSDHIGKGIRKVWEEGDYDLLVIGASQHEFEPRLRTKLAEGEAVAIVNAPSPIANQFREFVEEGLQRFVPQIEREDRVALVDRVQSSAAWNFDFLALMVLSTTIAAIGLIQNSAAVVIGAMLVAPLMTPLLGLGIALVQGNPVLARLSLQSTALGLGVSLLVGLVVGICTPGLEEPTREMLARGGPGLLDLGVAFAAGLAAAYASSRPGLLAALPGVAIAAALVPPIATSGLALSLGDLSLAIGAIVLFMINMVTIVLASMASFWAVGLRNLKKSSLWTVFGGSAVMVSVLALGVILSLQPKVNELTEPLPTGLAEAVRDGLGERYRLESVAVAYDELGAQLNVRIMGTEPPPEDLTNTVRIIARDFYQKPVRVRLVTQIVSEAGPDP